MAQVVGGPGDQRSHEQAGAPGGTDISAVLRRTGGAEAWFLDEGAFRTRVSCAHCSRRSRHEPPETGIAAGIVCVRLILSLGQRPELGRKDVSRAFEPRFRQRITKSTLKTYEQGSIVASINSDSFLGHQGATITVVIDRPAYAVVQLHVKVYVQPDVVVEPGQVDFGEVAAGQSTEKTLSIRARRGSRWAIIGVEAPEDRYATELVETSRRYGRVEYSLRVRLREGVEPGLLSDVLLLKTNDPAARQIPVAVRGRVLAPLSVSPSSLFLGVLLPGQKVSRALVIRGPRPFRILSVTADGEGFSFSEAGPGSGNPAAQTPRPLHVISVSFTAGEQPGPVARTIRVTADLEAGAEVAVPLSALVVEP